MNDFDSTQEFLQSLPEVGENEAFEFACHPQVRCFGHCCGDLNLMLPPYDALRLRANLGEHSKDFIGKRCTLLNAPDTGFPLLRLNMSDGEGKPCTFVDAQGGCGVYPDRPAACRMYPLGKATRLAEDGSLETRYFVVQEPHCKGFEESTTWTPASWQADQGLEGHNLYNDRFAALMGRQKAAGHPVDQRHASMVFLALYQPDRFQEYLRDVGALGRLDLTDEQREQILADEFAALDFAFGWLELALFKDETNLRRLQK